MNLAAGTAETDEGDCAGNDQGKDVSGELPFSDVLQASVCA